MTIRSILSSPIRSPLRSVFADSRFAELTWLLTSDNDVLVTTDNALMTLGGPQALSATRPGILLVTTDNDILFTTDNDMITV